jgi:hypothetical protein
MNQTEQMSDRVEILYAELVATISQMVSNIIPAGFCGLMVGRKPGDLWGFTVHLIEAQFPFSRVPLADVGEDARGAVMALLNEHVVPGISLGQMLVRLNVTHVQREDAP